MSKHKNNPKISVIIPTYNRANLLSRAIKSVLNQTFCDFELIIVDDCSTDNTEEIVEKFKKQDRRIRYFKHLINSGGPSRGSNTGIKNSKGKYIAFLDDDDEWSPKKLEKQFYIFRNNSDLGSVATGIYTLGEDGKINKFKFKYKNKILTSKNFDEFFQKWGVISLSCVMIKADVFKTIGFFDENFKILADRDIYFRILKKYAMYFLNEPLVNYYIRKDNLSKTDSWLKWISEYKYLLSKYEEDFRNYPKTHSKFLRTLGTYYILKDDISEGRKYILRAILENPTNVRLYFQYFLTFLGKNIYKFILFIKKNIS